MEQLLVTETLIIELLLIVSIVAIVVQRLRLPYTVALVMAGLLLTFQQTIRLELTPELILTLFVPPLVFEAAFHLELHQLRDNLIALLVLAVPGVLLTTFIVGWIIAAGVHLPLPAGLVFGALIAATDPVAVVALFRTLGVPKPLAVIVEGESLLNDGTAVVVFNLVVAGTLSTAATGAELSGFPLATVLFDFVRVVVGGIVVGVALGWLVAELIARVDDYLIETTLTTVLAFGAYIVSERLHVSGVLAVVSAGIVNGNIGPRGMSPTTRIVLFNFWEYLAFVANSLVFLLIGLSVNVRQIAANPGPIAVAVAAVILSRALVVYGLTWVANLRRRTVSWAYQHVLFWGGLRGAMSLALALSLPASLAERELLRVMAFSVVLFTLLVQGTTMQVLLGRLGLVRHSDVSLEYERRRGRLMAARAAHARLRQLYDDGMISVATWERLSIALDTRAQANVDAQRDLLRDNPALHAEELDYAQREALRAQRAVLGSLLSDGVISDRIYAELVTEVDAALQGEGKAEPATAADSATSAASAEDG